MVQELGTEKGKEVRALKCCRDRLRLLQLYIPYTHVYNLSNSDLRRVQVRRSLDIQLSIHIQLSLQLGIANLSRPAPKRRRPI